MEFRQAIQVAKNNPGTILARDHDGSFVVKNPDGTMVADGSHDSRSEDSTNEIGLLEDTIRDLQSKLHHLESTNSALNEKLRVTQIRYERISKQRDLKYKKEIQDLKSELKEKRTSNATLKKKLSSTVVQLEVLTNKFEMVNEEEQKRIQNQEVEDRRRERHTVQCSCLGEVENCHYCYGKGTYVTDGFGNRV